MRFTLFASICIVIFIFLQLVSGTGTSTGKVEIKFLRVPKIKGLQCDQTLKLMPESSYHVYYYNFLVYFNYSTIRILTIRPAVAYKLDTNWLSICLVYHKAPSDKFQCKRRFQ